VVAIPSSCAPPPVLHRERRGREDLPGLRQCHFPRRFRATGSDREHRPGVEPRCRPRTRLGSRPTSVAGVSGVDALNIDPEQAAFDYRERTVAPYRGVLPEQEVALLTERLSGACTVEVAAFDEFALLLSDPEATAAHDHVIFDTAPTGHTLRLLELPAAWTGFLEAAPGDVSCLGPLSGLKAQRERYEATVRALSNPSATAIILVSRPDRVALIEAARTSTELRNQEMTNQQLVINGVFRVKPRPECLMLSPFCASANNATRGSGFSSRSAPGRLMMG
jgi:anion-transporting  ArsA/GET3 family ATPase